SGRDGSGAERYHVGSCDGYAAAPARVRVTGTGVDSPPTGPPDARAVRPLDGVRHGPGRQTLRADSPGRTIDTFPQPWPAAYVLRRRPAWRQVQLLLRGTGL